MTATRARAFRIFSSRSNSEMRSIIDLSDFCVPMLWMEAPGCVSLVGETRLHSLASTGGQGGPDCSPAFTLGDPVRCAALSVPSGSESTLRSTLDYRSNAREPTTPDDDRWTEI